MKTRAGTKTITLDNKDKAKDLLKAIGIKPELKVVAPVYAQAAASPLPSPQRPKPQAQVIQPAKPPPAAAEAAAKPPPPPPAVAVTKPPPPPPPAAGPPPPPPPAAASEKSKTTTSSVLTKEDEKALISAGAIPLTDAMKEVLKAEPTNKFMVPGWTVGLKENDDVLDYLQDVINKISEDNDFMKDFENSRGSGKIKFYKM